MLSKQTLQEIVMADTALDAGLVARYGGTGPRYTSYPTALQFGADFTAADHRRFASKSNTTSRPLSVYVHIPFCESLCYYCACTKIVTRNAARVERYLEDLHREIDLQGTLFTPHRVVRQLHFGGGTPTYLDAAQMTALMGKLAERFTLATDDEREFSIEVDPRTVDAATLDALVAHGFNRLSLGIQDFDPRVQKAVNREQSVAEVAALTTHARGAGFESVSFDLIYGLPHQTSDSFDTTLDRVVDIRPDRIAVYNYAHLPDRFKGQRMIRAEDLPTPDTRLAILNRTLERLAFEGYEYIGMDHFALPEDELSVARRDGTLQRNFQGYSTHGDCDLVGLGISAISHVGDSYSQNLTATADYGRRLAGGELPICRGVELSEDDRLRATVIQKLMCYDELRFADFEAQSGVPFTTYFEHEMAHLAPLERDGLVDVDLERLRISTRGRLLLRTIASVFDRYSGHAAFRGRFSQTI